MLVECWRQCQKPLRVCLEVALPGHPVEQGFEEVKGEIVWILYEVRCLDRLDQPLTLAIGA